jgi:hypothetical protein
MRPTIFSARKSEGKFNRLGKQGITGDRSTECKRRRMNVATPANDRTRAKAVASVSPSVEMCGRTRSYTSRPSLSSASSRAAGSASPSSETSRYDQPLLVSGSEATASWC